LYSNCISTFIAVTKSTVHLEQKSDNQNQDQLKMNEKKVKRNVIIPIYKKNDRIEQEIQSGYLEKSDTRSKNYSNTQN